jgi:hypothetical protein
LRQREGLLAVIVTGPGDDERLIGIASEGPVSNEALLGDIELAAETPIVGGEKIVLLVLGRDRDLDCFSGIFAALELPGALPVGVPSSYDGTPELESDF